MRRVGLMGKVGMGASIAAAIVVTVVGCGNMDSTEGTVGADDSTQTSELWRNRRKPPAPQPPPTSTGSGGSTGGTLTTEQVIRAAQTADGAAIPQPSGPNHTCPEVVVRLGFWSCPTIGDTCASGGRSCVCSRTDGEGQFPSWICN